MDLCKSVPEFLFAALLGNCGSVCVCVVCVCVCAHVQGVGVQ